MVAHFAPDILDQLKDWHLICLETENTFAFALNFKNFLFHQESSLTMECCSPGSWVLQELHGFWHSMSGNLFVHFSDLL